MAEKRADLDDVFEYGVDIKNRRIFFGGSPEATEEDGDGGSDFTWQSVEIAARAIKAMEGRSHQPIELYMSSNGGDVYEMMRLHDIIQASPCQFIFYGSGKICSAASYVMACCDERYLSPNSRVLLHHGSDSEAGSHIDFLSGAENSSEITFQANKILAANSRMPVEFWQDLLRHDIWLNPEETIALGLADRVVEPKKRGNLRKLRVAQLNQTIDKKDMTKLIKSLYRRQKRSNITSLEIKAPVEEFDPTVSIPAAEAQTCSPVFGPDISPLSPAPDKDSV